LGPTEVRKICRLDETGRGLVKAAMLAGASRPAPAWLQMSARAFHRILKLARTIADLAGSERIETAHPSTLAQDKPGGGDPVPAKADDLINAISSLTQMGAIQALAPTVPRLSR
jgi:hypothetical protein